LQETHRRDDTALLVVTHDDAVAGLFDRTVVIRDGLLSEGHT
jgi:ABC-type lipoprotein export system ATPase subunit